MPLISPEALRSRLSSVRLLDVRQESAEFEAGHLPGALHADLNRHLSAASDPGFDPARGGRHPLPEPARFAAQLGAWGIGPDTEVVVYDASGGGNAAARLWWMLRALGHARVAVLDGGLPAALEAGLPLTRQVAFPARLSPYPGPRWTWPIADIAQVEDRRQDPSRKVLDVRAPERYRGETETLDPVAGHIPGALNAYWGDNLGPDGRFKTPEALRRSFLDLLDGTPADRLTVHCGSGVTACHTLLALEHAGLPGAALYVGSWSEWCRSGRELVLGPAQDEGTLR